MATHSSVLAWRIPGTGEPGRLPSMGSRRVGHDWSDLAAAAAALHSSLNFGFVNFFFFLKWQSLFYEQQQKKELGTEPMFSVFCFRDCFVVAKLLSRVWLFATPWTAAHQASLPFTISWNLLKFMSIESVILSNHANFYRVSKNLYMGFSYLNSSNNHLEYWLVYEYS